MFSGKPIKKSVNYFWGNMKGGIENPKIKRIKYDENKQIDQSDGIGFYSFDFLKLFLCRLNS